MSPTDEIKQKLDIVDLVSETVKLRRSGRAYSGLCPFHQNTRTPAFYVFPETQTWHCFGACGTGGDVFTFVMKKQNVDFGEALRMLAERAGVQLHRDMNDDGETKRLVEINQLAAAYFQYQLKNHPAAQYVRSYVQERRINANSIEAFQIGFAPNSLNGLLEHLKSKGFTVAELERAGVVSTTEEGIVRDRFRGRLMFPIRNRRGQTIAFGARALAQDQQPKYLNSPDTPLFSKSDTLYGIDFAKDAIRAENLAIIVEGYTDVIIAHQQGFKNVVASLGTALTEKQLAQLSRMTKRYALALDADEAGAAATERGLALARQALTRKQVPIPVGPGLVAFEERLDAELLIMTLPEGKDPDQVILDDPQAWRDLVTRALPLVDFTFQTQTRDLDLRTAHGKSEAVRRLLPIIGEIQDQVQRTHYTHELARLVQTDERIIAQQLLVKKSSPQTSQPRERTHSTEPKSRAETTPAASTLPSAKYDEYLITLVLYQPELMSRVHFISADDFEEGSTREIWQTLTRLSADPTAFDVDQLLDTLSDAARETGERLHQAAKRLEFNAGEAAREIEAAAYRLRLQRYQDELTQLRHLLAESPTEEQLALVERVNDLRAWMGEARRALDARNVLKTSVPTRI